ncbi:hypothetical protein B0H13DRAFT_1889840 [Mycena leptocephala]|nr:hypothetical protein B0H13DRAFT_1889840 [Mycena leptocephala]
MQSHHPAWSLSRGRGQEEREERVKESERRESRSEFQMLIVQFPVVVGRLQEWSGEFPEMCGRRKMRQAKKCHLIRGAEMARLVGRSASVCTFRRLKLSMKIDASNGRSTAEVDSTGLRAALENTYTSTVLQEFPRSYETGLVTSDQAEYGPERKKWSEVENQTRTSAVEIRDQTWSTGCRKIFIDPTKTLYNSTEVGSSETEKQEDVSQIDHGGEKQEEGQTQHHKESKKTKP